MATFIVTLVALLMALFRSTISTNVPPKDQDLRFAMEEMQKANYFTFVMLINMSPLNPNFLGNVTFLMPTDRMLSKTIIPQNAVSNFLHRHSIPSPLLFEHLQHIPTGSILPSSIPEYMLNISNGGGRRSFFLNNVRIITPNICTAGSSIRCHGIDGVLRPGSNISPPTCSDSAASPVASPPSPSPVPFLPFLDDFPVPAPQPADSSQHNSGSSQFLSDRKLLKFIGTLLVVFMNECLIN
ncbi:FAS1 domain-containing protein SELMODRAFT_448915-like [Durio zibethinus]|uniref:FAS1 domain-containing protein SELMODRAFT_448915-like n=1 Tax=Durio zibethinus TaxID=66656 RepID=A0A6P5Z4P1_DURZI|nr:FAS1 domain-containing protein SELMODRAFT_448915-like [Durio zibethinus]